MSHTRVKRRRVENSICTRILEAQICGRGFTRLGQVPNHVIHDFSEQMDLKGIPALIKDVDDCSIHPEYDSEDTLDTLKGLLGSLTNFEVRRSQDEGTGEEQNRCAVIFEDYGGLEVVLRLLMHSSLLPIESIHSAETEIHLRIKSVCLEILSKIISSSIGEKVAQDLTAHDDTVNYLFTLLSHEKTSLTACQFLEDLLQQRKLVLNLTRITNMKQLIACLDDHKLANFCRVLAVTISDLDIYENKSSLFAQNKQKRSRGFQNVRDVNQELLLSIPDLLPRLINIACIKNYTPRYRGMVSELDCWMEWIDNALSDSVFDPPNDDDLDDFIGGISASTVCGGPMNQQSGLKISIDLILRVQVVYVLGLFLVGKNRKKVQRKLADLKLVPGLSDLFDQFIWKCQVHRNNLRHRLRGHNASCECSPEVALKIQFLRLVHSFCDHSDFKHLLLSKSELNEIKKINAKAGPLEVEDLDNINKSLMCRGSKGLLTKIVEVMKKEPTASTFRFWLARAVESYLRGSTYYCDQVFLLRRGLLTHIAGNIVDHDIRPKEILQSSFDLLGELIKFNIEAFKIFDKILHNTQRFDKFLKIMRQNLVDSNMFIRSLILSMEHFLVQQPEHKEYALKESRLLMHVADFGNQIDYLYKLINIINVQNLTQENVSCLNTTLVILMFSNQKSQMPNYLKSLRDEKATPVWERKGGLQIMRNFRDLLTFWQEHYLHKDKDCSALEKSSRIKFEYWKETVCCLVDEDREKGTSIVHYMPPCTCRNC